MPFITLRPVHLCLVPSNALSIVHLCLVSFNNLCLVSSNLCLVPSNNFLTLLCSVAIASLILCKFAQKIWIKLLSSPLLEFYVREIFVILQSFDIVSENDFLLYKCQQINLTLKRHFYKWHDYKVLVDKVTYYHAICIHPTPMF